MSTVEEKQSKFSRGLLLFFIGATALFFIVLIVLFLMSTFGKSEKEAVALLAGNHYAIVKEENSYTLYDQKENKPILEDVNGYFGARNIRSYVKNDTELVSIDEKEEEYTKKPLEKATQAEKDMFKKMKKLD